MTVAVDTTRRARVGRSTLLVWGGFAVAALLAAALLLHVGRGLTWFFDEWDWVQGRRTGSLDDLLRDHNGHLVALPILAYKLSWQWFGLQGYTAMRVYTVALHLGTCAALLVWLRRRLRDELALAAVVMVLFLGFAWQAVTTGTPDEGARLDVDFRPARQRCASCGEVPGRQPGSWLRVCAGCGGLLSVEGGDELDVLSVTFEEPDGSGA